MNALEKTELPLQLLILYSWGKKNPIYFSCPEILSKNGLERMNWESVLLERVS